MKTYCLSIKNSLLLLTGMITMLHMVIILPYFLYGAFILLLLLASLFYLMYNNKKRTGLIFIWYGTFVIYITFSLLWTVNKINPDYVLKRVWVIFVLCCIVSFLLENRNDFFILIKGLIIGAAIVCCVAIFYEMGTIGSGNSGRIGEHTVGSAVALSGIALVGLYCSSFQMIYNATGKRKKFFCLYFFFLIAIMLSASRRAMIIGIIFPFLLLIFGKRSSLNKKILYTCISIVVLCTALYLFLTVDVFYNLIGYRIDTLLSSVTNSTTVSDESSLEREAMKRYAWTLFFKKPIFGYGVHGFAYEFFYYYGKLLYSHCGYTEILSCYGILGFVLFYWIFLYIFSRMKRSLAKCHDICIFLSIVVFIVLLTESISIAFITPQIVVLLTIALLVFSRPENYQLK